MKKNLAKNLIFFVIILTTLLAAPVSAQITNGHLISTETDGVTKVLAADINADGIMDFVSASQNDDKIAWYQSNGEGGYIQHIVSVNVNGASDLVLEDLDLDGDLDIISVAKLDNKIMWFRNNGLGSFSNMPKIGSMAAPEHLAVIDLDDDGDVDVVSASRNQLYWFKNDGNSYFIGNIISDSLNAPVSIKLGDINNDGYTDIVLGQEMEVVLFTGSDSQTYNSETLVDVYSPVTLADLDFDGSLDIISMDLWLQNNGEGGFLRVRFPESDVGIGWPTSIEVADLTDNGYLDILLSFETQEPYGSFDWLRNDGTNHFVGQKINNSAAGASSIVAADVDNDGDLDVVTGRSFDDYYSPNDDVIAWYENEGRYDYPIKSINDSESTKDIIKIDLDKDSDEDLVLIRTTGEIIWYKNEGLANFTPITISSSTYNNQSIGVADFDDDDDIDILVGTAENNIALLLNDGDQGFVEKIISSDIYRFNELVVHDLDQDGDQDFLTALSFNTGVTDHLHWFENDGTGGFLAHPISTDRTTALSVIDLDNDGDFDILSVGNGRVSWHKNDGEQNFLQIQLVENFKYYYDVRAVDLNRDEQVDFITGSSSDIVWYQNNGQQSFTPKLIGADNRRSYRSVNTVDLDYDGDLDVIAATSKGVSFYENIGNEGFLNYVLDVGGAIYTEFEKVLPFDVDGNGATDVISSTQSFAGLRWYENLIQVDLSTDDVPDNHISSTYLLDQNYPNPFNYETVISYQLQKRSPVILKIYNQLGQLVNSVIGEDQPAGGHQISWNGTDQAGNKLASGIYIYRLTTNEFTETRKMIIIR